MRLGRRPTAEVRILTKFAISCPLQFGKDIKMATMNVSLPDAMKLWVEAQSATGRYSNASDYVRDLIRRDQERRDKIGHMQTLVSEALDSGVSERSMADIRTAARARLDPSDG